MLRSPVGRRALAGLPAVVAALVLTLPAGAGAYVYWANGGDNAIGRGNLDGSGVDHRFIPTSYPSAVAVDGSHLYWGTGSYTTARANLDGSGAGEFVNSFSRYGVAVDGQHVYWAAAGSIGRANLDGSAVDTSFITGVRSACGVAVDAGHVYWGETDAAMIGRAKLDGSGVEHDFITTSFGPCGVAVDGAHIYWANWWDGGTTIGRANLDGSGANQSFIGGAYYPCGVAVDGSHVYWVNQNGGIGRANLDGSGVDQRFIESPALCGVAVDSLLQSATTLTASKSSIFYGEPVTFTAAVAAPAPAATGTVRFTVDGAPAGAAVPIDAQGHAAFTPAEPLDVGATVMANYSGDTRHGASRSALLRPTIRPAATAITLSSSANPQAFGSAVTLIASVVNTSTGVVPFGSVQFMIDGAPVLDPIELDEAGRAGIAGTPPAAGEYIIEAFYEDDTGAIADFTTSHTAFSQRFTSPIAPAAAAPARATPVVRPVQQASCIVPRLQGLRLAAAQAKLVKAHCALGKVTRKPGRRSQRGRVRSSKPSRGRSLPAGSKVALVIGK
jgi:virginiamycin B lyase